MNDIISINRQFLIMAREASKSRSGEIMTGLSRTALDRIAQMRYAFLATLPCLLLIFGRAMANDLGVVGSTYEIVERDLIEVMKDKFRRMEKSGELARVQENYKQKVIDAVEKPRPVHGVSSTETVRTFYVDPTWTLDRNVVDEQGKLLFPAGTKVNPLDYAPLTQYLLFFDQREKAQVAFARRFVEQSKARVKPILVGGEPLKLMRQWKREVFYDQGGVLSRKFLLKQSPAIVSQEGKRLRIDEIHPYPKESHGLLAMSDLLPTNGASYANAYYR